ncbi:hypothetical protein HYALB_00005595 [Hymenoscyphus albidus]|uniref:F-box domain-containing protein n=1 Tax=Hymenoscyphus albidus TaxID=595503 RepID=A0A9N9LEF8_9HELO|nr:hypothetical protein HYALB_00005595 [Hymenoscyphus albidus]
MHRALGLTEIVATIVETGSASLDFLRSCLLINKFFSHEAARLIWKECGLGKSYISPQIGRLVRTLSENAQRAQYYANFVQTLCIFQRKRNIWHEYLASLEFPRLKNFHRQDTEMTGPPIDLKDLALPYPQRGLEALSIYRSSVLIISDCSLEILSSHTSPKLKKLNLFRMQHRTVSKDGLVRFLTNTNPLVELDISCLDKCWSRKAFQRILLRFCNLVYLSLPDIPDDWILSPSKNDTNVPPAFPNLRTLRVGVNEQGLELLARNAPALETLELSSQDLPPSRHILLAAAGFTKLRRLIISFGQSSRIYGEDLLLLSQECPCLTCLSIQSNKGFHPKGLDISDNLIEEVAQNLTELITLTICIDSPSPLTQRAVYSVIRHCKDISYLHMSCDFNWRETVDGVPEFTSAKMLSMTLLLNENGPLADANEELANRLRKRLVLLTPAMKYLYLQSRNRFWAIEFDPPSSRIRDDY